jgi:hypothetical protein
MDAASGMIDWKFAPKWDTYVGTFFSQMNDGLANGTILPRRPEFVFASEMLFAKRRLNRVRAGSV